MIGASMLSLELQAFRADVHAEVKRLVTPGVLFALDRNEIPYPLDFIRAMGGLGRLGGKLLIQRDAFRRLLRTSGASS